MPAVTNTYLQDSAGQVRLLAANNLGAYTTIPVTGPTGLPFILITDQTSGAVFKMILQTDGSLHIDPASGFGVSKIPVLTPNGTPMAIVVAANRIDTILIQLCALSLFDATVLLAARLADSSFQFWTQAELYLYIQEALRTWNALTEIWNADFAFTATQSSGHWYDLSVLPKSPRLRTVLDSDLYTVMQYHLLESPSGGGTWGGTSQFSLLDMQGALLRRRDELIQLSGCNVAHLPALPSTPNARRTIFSDSTLEPRRVRFVPATNFGKPVTLSREDSLAFDGFEPQHLQTPAMPGAWNVISTPPLAMDVDTPPNVPGTYDVLSLQSGPTFSPSAQSLMGVPDDWTWVAKWGALADLLSRDSEATDRQRADYCLTRYTDGIKIMQASNWLVSATINGLPVDTPSVRESDGFAPEWENNANAWPSLVTAGMDLVAPCPVAGSTPVGVSVVVVGNAPVPVVGTDCVLVSRDTVDAILDYAQRLALFKCGGVEFMSAMPLELNFYRVAQANTLRRSKTGIFTDLLRSEGRRQDLVQPRQ